MELAKHQHVMFHAENVLMNDGWGAVVLVLSNATSDAELCLLQKMRL